MSYEVLARKYRPRRFADVVGQKHVVDSLRNALASGRLHHAYLFTGTRGVGKTTLARILTRALNCERGPQAEPCGECQSCLDIDLGRHPDLIEVDAASRTKVDETRELLDDVHYAPARGRFKVYLIDEVHMFSDKSFNALLKTLEEPPAHVKFLLATTEARKLPITVLSRCLQFTLKHVGPEAIALHLAHILDQEAIGYEPAACRLVADAAAGSVRDALSLLDQAVVHGGGRVQTATVAAMLGVLERDRVLQGLEILLDGEAGPVLTWLHELAEVHSGFSDFEGVLVELLRLLQRLAVLQLAPELAAGEEDERLKSLTARLTPEDVQLYYQIGLQGRRDLTVAPDPQTGLEMTLLRMLAFKPDTGPVPPATGSARRSGGLTEASGPAGRSRPSLAAPATALEAAAHPSLAAAVSLPAEPTNTAMSAPVAIVAVPPPSAGGRSPAETIAPSPTALASPTLSPTPASLLTTGQDGAVSDAPYDWQGGDRGPDAPRSPPAWLDDWPALAPCLPLSGLPRELAMQTRCVSASEESLRLAVVPGHVHLVTDRNVQRLEEALAAHLGCRPKVVVLAGDAAPAGAESASERQARVDQGRLQALRQHLEQHPFIQATTALLGARMDAVKLADHTAPTQP